MVTAIVMLFGFGETHIYC